MRPVSVFAKAPGSEIEQLRDNLHGRWRQATPGGNGPAVAARINASPDRGAAGLPPATVRRWISRFNSEGPTGLADRPRCGRPRIGGRRLTSRITALLGCPGPWTLPRIRRYLGWPQATRARSTGGSGWWRSGGGPS